MPQVKPVPDGFNTVTAAMVIKDAAKAIDFYKKAFGAEEVMRIKGPHDAVLHAEIRVGDSTIMISEEWPGHHIMSPASLKGTSCGIHLYVDNVDSLHKRAVGAGATEKMAPVDMFWGDRFSALMDPFGHAWSIGTHIKELSPEECQKACDQWMAQMAAEGGKNC